MQRKPGFPVANCNIKLPDSMPVTESVPLDEDGEQMQKRQQLINFGHAQWGFNNWSWSVTKQELDFVDFANGKYCSGVVAFVSVTVKNFDIHRENIGYATSLASNKGAAIYKSRKAAVTNGLRETLLSFGGNVATELMELLETHRSELPTPAPASDLQPENNQNVLNKITEPKNSPLSKNIRKDSMDSTSAANIRIVPPAIKNVPPPVAKAHPIPAGLPPAANRAPLPANAPRAHPAPPPAHPALPAQHVRPNSNELRSLESMSEEEARVERKRRQQKAQEEFRLKQMMKQKHDEKQDQHKSSSSGFDTLLMDIPTQNIEIEQTGDEGKRKSPAPDTSAKRRASLVNRLLEDLMKQN